MKHLIFIIFCRIILAQTLPISQEDEHEKYLLARKRLQEQVNSWILENQKREQSTTIQPQTTTEIPILPEIRQENPLRQMRRRWRKLKRQVKKSRKRYEKSLKKLFRFEQLFLLK